LPFLDQELVETVLALPPDAIIANGWNRRVQREALRDVLPDAVYRRRRKIGFTTPEFRWFAREQRFLGRILRSERFAQRPYWDGPAVADAFARACRGEIEESMFFWRAINAELWMRRFIDRPSKRAEAVDRDAPTRRPWRASRRRVAIANPARHQPPVRGNAPTPRIPTRPAAH
jgi:asparagine synthase (glutamine-hydrolysing)